jgi:hypothetical protein
MPSSGVEHGPLGAKADPAIWRQKTKDEQKASQRNGEA